MSDTAELSILKGDNCERLIELELMYDYSATDFILKLDRVVVFLLLFFFMMSDRSSCIASAIHCKKNKTTKKKNP